MRSAEMQSKVEVISGFGGWGRHRYAGRNSAFVGGAADYWVQSGEIHRCNLVADSYQSNRTERSDVWCAKASTVIECDVQSLRNGRHCPDAPGEVIDPQRIVR